jgi:FKBP-type peptidyl-prolyl cis-trans isomerase FklB
MKIKPYFLLIPLMTAFGLVSCIDANETDEVILEKDIKAIAEFIEANPLVNVKEFTDPSTGIKIVWQEVSSSGIKSENGDTLRLDYTGKLLSNKVFDTSIESVAKANGIFSSGRNYIPLKFPLGNRLLIPGFEYGAAQMEEGDKATVFIPSVYGYGNNSSGDVPARSPLIFEINLIDVKDGPQK